MIVRIEQLRREETVDCSRDSTRPCAEDKRLFLALMAIGEKGQSIL